MWLHTANPFLNKKGPPLIAPRSAAAVSFSFQQKFAAWLRGAAKAVSAMYGIQPNALGRSVDAWLFSSTIRRTRGDRRPIVGDVSKSI